MISKGLDIAQNLGTQKVIGFTRTVTRTKGKKNPKQITESVSVGVQAWEIAAFIAAAGLYEYVNGPGSLLGPNGSLSNVITPGLTGTNPLSGVTTLPLTVGLSNPVIL